MSDSKNSGNPNTIKVNVGDSDKGRTTTTSEKPPKPKTPKR